MNYKNNKLKKAALTTTQNYFIRHCQIYRCRNVTSDNPFLAMITKHICCLDYYVISMLKAILFNNHSQTCLNEITRTHFSNLDPMRTRSTSQESRTQLTFCCVLMWLDAGQSYIFHDLFQMETVSALLALCQVAVVVISFPTEYKTGGFPSKGQQRKICCYLWC